LGAAAVICTGCGLEINDRAPSCFKCGTINPAVAPPAAREGDPLADPALGLILPVGRSPLSVIAGYLGLLSFLVGCLAPIALGVSIAAIVDLKRHPEKRGMGRAVFGLVCGTFVTVGMLVVLILAVAGVFDK
jgi:hypothetical protein